MTYRDEDLPHIHDFLELPESVPDIACFNRADIRYFLVRLRRMLSYRHYPSFKYFICAELGSKKRRPHYHILCFCPKEIDPLVMCRLIHRSWKHGITDWSAPFHGDNYILNNRVFNDYSLHGMRLANYVAKYVQKDSKYTLYLKKLINDVLDAKYVDSDYSTLACRKSDYIKLKNVMMEFHLQSHGFGQFYLDSPEFNLDELNNTGMIKMIVPDNFSIYKHIPIPMYYFRKLFQEQIYVDGKRCWQLTASGVVYRKASEIRKHRNLVLRFQDFKSNVASLPEDLRSDYLLSIDGVDFDSLASYVLFLRGRYKSVVDYAPLSVRLEDISFYHYGSLNDAIIYDKKFVTNRWLGNDVLGYDSIPDRVYSRHEFFQTYTYIDSRLEFSYQVYLVCCRYLSSSKQHVFDYRQQLEKVYKDIFARL